MEDVKEKSKEMINMIYQPLGNLSLNENSETMWNWSKLRAIENVRIIKKEVPMYLGNLNPLWLFWDNVEKEIFIQ